MASATDNNQFELPQAPAAGSKKRKRNENQIYKGPRQLKTSTPIFERKYENPSFVFQNPKKSNGNYFADPCLEIKSIADLLAASKALEPVPAPAVNPYEITRKPPKKKKRHEGDNCFENPALDINGPEKAVNPYEVTRQVIADGPDHCFSNPGLNIRGPDHHEQPSFVPFEIKRPAVAEDVASDRKGIENLALEVPQQQQQYALAVPFTPTLGRRINFNEISPSALTPCEMLSKQLTIKDATPKQTPKVLSVISEEVDIGEELDCYQLELENSINEAKMERQTGRRRTLEARRVSSLSQKLKNLAEEDESEEEPVAVEPTELHLAATPKYLAKSMSRIVVEASEPPAQPLTTVTKLSDSEISLNIKDASHHLDFDVKIKISDNAVPPQTSADVEYEELDEDEDVTFAKPAPFRRAYRKDPVAIVEQDAKEPEPVEKIERKGVKSAIRSSIRRLMHPHTKDKTKEEPTKDEKSTKDEQPGLFQAIRHSFRRNKVKQPTASTDAEHQNEKENVMETTIIDDMPRKLFRQPEVGEVKRVEITAADKVATSTFTRVGSLRMRKQVMKSVFKKSVDEFDVK